MNGFWGVFKLSSSPSHYLDLESTIQNLSKHLPDSDVFSTDGAFLATINGSYPLIIDKDNKLTVAGWVRLDNYLDLVKELQLSPEATDLDLIKSAYLKWGNSCLDHFYGDFSFVIYDWANNHLFLAKDQLGIRPLFYTVYNESLIFATQIDLIKKVLPIKPELNLVYIAKELKNFPPVEEETFFKSIHRLKPAHFIFIQDNSDIKESRYWDLTPISLPKLNNHEEYHNLVRSYFIRAIETRTRGRKVVGCQLSGGMDSSAIAVILSRVFPKEGLHTYSFVLDEHTTTYSDSGIDEKGTQEEVIQYADLIRENHHPITKFHFRDVYEELETQNQVMGGLADSDTIWQDSLFKYAAEQQQVEVMFSGFPGDEGISCPAKNYYHEYLYKKDILGIISHVFRFRKSGLSGIINYYRLKKLGTTKPDYTNLQKKRSILNPALENDFSLKDSSFAFRPSFKGYFKSQITRAHTCLRTESEGSYANRHGIETVYPMADLRLIQLVYSLPVELFIPKPHSRALFRNICKGILPEKVRTQEKFNGAKTLAFADYWIKTKKEQLQDYPIKNSLNLMISEEEYAQRQPENEFIGIKRLVEMKQTDYLIEKNR